MANGADIQTEIKLENIGQIALTVDNLAQAKEFYRDVLGMPFLFEAGSMVFFQCGPVRLMLGRSEKPIVPAGTILYFNVPRIDEVATALKAKDIPFLQEPHLVARMPDHDLFLALFPDPSGNTLALMSEVKRAG